MIKIWKVEGKAPNMGVLNHALLFYILVNISSKMNLISRLYTNMSFPSRRIVYHHDKYISVNISIYSAVYLYISKNAENLSNGTCNVY